MRVLTGMKFDNTQWDDGKILDPANGKFYDCILKLSENPNQLNVRGYIGIPLLGRSQAWLRVHR